MPLKINQPAPDFCLPSTSGSDFCLSKDQAGKPCILYFYPKDFTPGCTREACDFRDHFEMFKELKIDVYGISTDSLDTHHQFKQKHHLPFDLLSDENRQVIQLYEARAPLLGFAKRVSYLLDEKHQIAAVYDNFLKAGNHLKKMVEAVRK